MVFRNDYRYIRARRHLGPGTRSGAIARILAATTERMLSAANLVEVGIIMQAGPAW